MAASDSPISRLVVSLYIIWDQGKFSWSVKLLTNTLLYRYGLCFFVLPFLVYVVKRVSSFVESRVCSAPASTLARVSILIQLDTIFTTAV